MKLKIFSDSVNYVCDVVTFLTAGLYMQQLNIKVIKELKLSHEDIWRICVLGTGVYSVKIHKRE
jgi:hypothetical protein